MPRRSVLCVPRRAAGCGSHYLASRRGSLLLPHLQAARMHATHLQHMHQAGVRMSTQINMHLAMHWLMPLLLSQAPPLWLSTAAGRRSTAAAPLLYTVHACCRKRSACPSRLGCAWRSLPRTGARRLLPLMLLQQLPGLCGTCKQQGAVHFMEAVPAATLSKQVP